MPKKTRSKFNVNTSKTGKQNRTYNSIVFDSELEKNYYVEVVCVGIKDGSIKNCEMQIKYELQPKFKYQDKNILAVNYVADFVITYADDSVVVVDTKGLPDAVAKLKKKLFHFKYPDINYIWIGWSRIDGGFVEYDIIQKGRAKRKKEKEIIKQK